MKRVVIVLLLGLGLQPAPWGREREDQAPTPEMLLASVDRVLESVVRLRQLQPLEPLRRGIRSRQQIGEYVRQRLEEEYPAERLELEREALIRLGLLPIGFPLSEFLVELLTEQVAGFYDPPSKTFFVADWLPLPIQEPVMAHELTHALQDQHFGLGRFMKRSTDNDDALLAAQSVIEGEGLAVMFDYLLEPSGRSFLDLDNLLALTRSQIQWTSQASPVFSRAPSYLKEALLFPYVYGAHFIQAFRRKHSWGELARLYADMPASTEQILHPDKYLGQRDDPLPLAAGPGEPPGEWDSPPHWQRLYQNVFGEFGLFLALREFLEPAEAWQGAQGWGADRLELYRSTRGDWALRLLTLWDSPREASQFWESWIRRSRARHSGMVALQEAGEDSLRQFLAGHLFIQVSLRGREVEVWEVERVHGAEPLSPLSPALTPPPKGE